MTSNNDNKSKRPRRLPNTTDSDSDYCVHKHEWEERRIKQWSLHQRDSQTVVCGVHKEQWEERPSRQWRNDLHIESFIDIDGDDHDDDSIVLTYGETCSEKPTAPGAVTVQGIGDDLIPKMHSSIVIGQIDSDQADSEMDSILIQAELVQDEPNVDKYRRQVEEQQAQLAQKEREMEKLRLELEVLRAPPVLEVEVLRVSNVLEVGALRISFVTRGRSGTYSPKARRHEVKVLLGEHSSEDCEPSSQDFASDAFQESLCVGKSKWRKWKVLSRLTRKRC